MSKSMQVPSFVLVGVVALSAMTLGPAALCATSGDKAAAAAKAAVEARTALQTTWLGPTTGPKTDPGKFIVYISTGENNPIGHLGAPTFRRLRPRWAGASPCSTERVRRPSG